MNAESIQVASLCLKPGFHTCVSRTHNSARCLKMHGHQCSQAITTFATKACELATKSYMLNFCEGLRDLCRDILWLWPIETDYAKHKKYFLSCKKRAKLKTKNITTTFGKSLFLIKYIPDALRDLHASKYKRHRNKPDDGWLWKPAKPNKIRMSKQLRFVAITETFNRKPGLTVSVQHRPTNITPFIISLLLYCPSKLKPEN